MLNEVKKQQINGSAAKGELCELKMTLLCWLLKAAY